MAARDVLGLVKGVRLVLNSYVNNTAVEVRHCLYNSSVRPVVSYVCQTCEGLWKENDYDLNDTDFPGFPDDSFGGFPIESGWQVPDLEVPPVSVSSNGIGDQNKSRAENGSVSRNGSVSGNGTTTGYGRRQLHTWCYRKRFQSSTASSVPETEDGKKKKKYKITDNQQVIWR